MASGRKNYFRHLFNTHNNDKMQKAISLLGFEAYYYYFSLLELCGEKAVNEESTPKVFTFHQQSIRILWRKQSKSCKKVVEKLQESGLFVATFNESFIEFEIPNFPKYLGKYQIKNNSNAPKKRKEKERKEKNKEKESKVVAPSRGNKPPTHGVLNEFSSLEMEDYFMGISHNVQKKWISLYEISWIKSELKNADLWIETNPHKKPKSNFSAFFTRWLKNGWESHRKTIPSGKKFETFAQIRQNTTVGLENKYATELEQCENRDLKSKEIPF